MDWGREGHSGQRWSRGSRGLSSTIISWFVSSISISPTFSFSFFFFNQVAPNWSLSYYLCFVFDDAEKKKKVKREMKRFVMEKKYYHFLFIIKIYKERKRNADESSESELQIDIVILFSGSGMIGRARGEKLLLKAYFVSFLFYTSKHHERSTLARKLDIKFTERSIIFLDLRDHI